MSGRSASMVLLGIIALAGLGLSGYLFLKYESLSPLTPTNDSGLILVGLWNNINMNLDYPPYDSLDDFLLEFYESPFNDSIYVSMSSGNTRFVLKQAGFYKITLNLFFESISPSSIYNVYLLRNGAIERAFEYISISANPKGVIYYAKSSLYVYGNRTDYFVINCYSGDDSSFFVSATNQYNQLMIEYVLQ